MEFTLRRTKKLMIKDIFNNLLNLILLIISIIIISIGINFCINDNIKPVGVALIIIGGLYLLVLIYKSLKILLFFKDMTTIFRLEHDRLVIDNGDNSVTIAYKHIIRTSDTRIGTILILDKKEHYIDFLIPKDGFEHSRDILISKLNIICSDLYEDDNQLEEVLKEDDGNVILSFMPNELRDFKRQMYYEYSKVRRMLPFVANLFFGLTLLNGKTVPVGSFLILLSLILISNPIIKFIKLHKNRKKDEIQIINAENKIKIINKGCIYGIKKANLRIFRSGDDQVVIKNITNNHFIFEIHRDECIDGDINDLFHYMILGNQSLRRTSLGFISLCLSIVAVIFIPLILKIKMVSLIMSLGGLAGAIILAIINLFKKGVYKKYAVLSLSIDTCLILLFVLVSVFR